MNTATVGINYHQLKPLDVILQGSRYYVVETVHHDAFQVTIEAHEIGMLSGQPPNGKSLT